MPQRFQSTPLFLVFLTLVTLTSCFLYIPLLPAESYNHANYFHFPKCCPTCLPCMQNFKPPKFLYYSVSSNSICHHKILSLTFLGLENCFQTFGYWIFVSYIRHHISQVSPSWKKDIPQALSPLWENYPSKTHPYFHTKVDIKPNMCIIFLKIFSFYLKLW